MPQDNPPLLDKTMNTTESTPRNIADVLADELVISDLVTQATAIVTELQALINAVKPNASDIPLAPITGMSANNVQLGISELKGTLDDLDTLTPIVLTIQNKTGNSDCVIDTQNCYIKNNVIYLAITFHSTSNTSDISVILPNNKKFKQTGAIGTCGKGARWSVTGSNYMFVGESELSINNITTNTYYHIITVLPLR